MSYKQLLNPKAFAKEKEKEKGERSSKVKDGKQLNNRCPAPNSNTQQPSLPKFDPKALLNPKAAATRPAKMEVEHPPQPMNGLAHSSMDFKPHADAMPGMGGMIERMHGVTHREAPLKRKSQEVEDSGEDAAQKKTKTTFNSGGSSGIIGDHLKAERAKEGAQSGQMTEPIDLTADDDENENGDDEIVVLKETRVDAKEVCLGRLHAKANVFRVPKCSKSREGILGGTMWPQQRVEHKRVANGTHVIDLHNRTGGKFGSMDVNAASALCLLLDANNVSGLRIKVFLEAFQRRDEEVAGVTSISRALDLSILLYAPRGRADMIGRLLSQKNLFLTAPPALDRSIEYVNPHAPKNFGAKPAANRRPQGSTASFVTRTHEEMKRDASNVFDKLAENAKNLPEMEPNTDIITTTLLSHQKQALRFMVDHESGDYDSQGATVSLWRKEITNKGNNIWYNILTGHKVDREPEPERGGILADMMGLGKTLSILSLIAETLDESRQFGDTDAPIDDEDIERNAKTTLIICPKSVLSNWEEQIKIHTARKKLKFYAYHGTNRERDLDQLAEFDILLTTYSTASAEFSDQRDGRNTLKGMHFFRIVLDEGHQIRTQNTKVSQACCALSAQRRWVVTGTPVQNRLDDLGSLFRFLRIKPFDDKDSWARHVLAPFRNNSDSILESFRVLVDSITIRRQKDKIGLSARNEQLQRLEFSEEEQAIYQQFASKSNSELKRMLSQDNRLRGKSYAHVLRALGRLRAICAHGSEMLSEEDQKVLEGMTQHTAIDLGDEPDDEPDQSFISEKQAYDTYLMMKDSEVHVCAGCGNKLSDKETSDADMDDPSKEDTDSESEIESTDPSTIGDGEKDVLGFLTPCYHLICPNCHPEHVQSAAAHLTKDHYHRCKYCDQYIRFGLFELRQSTLTTILDARLAKQKGKKAKWDESTYSGPHTKVQALLEDLRKSATETAALPAGEPPIRSVVFSGWVTYLELIEHALEQNGFNSVRLDGTMSLRARRAVLDAFKSDPNVTILLVSIKAGGQGLNLTSASKVYMMEPQFNPGVELQAIDRVHRLGQHRDVDITHYIMKDSVEESILKLQEKKKKLAEMTMEKKMTKAEEAKEKIEYLKDLFK